MKANFMNQAFLEAMKALKQGEIPVGAVIVKNNEIVSSGYNMKEMLQISTQHAEIIAIEKACEILKNWRLNECDMYVTMEPCIMCCGAILQSRIRKVYYLTENKKFGGVENVKEILGNNKYNHKTVYEKYIDEELYNKNREILKEFFSARR